MNFLSNFFSAVAKFFGFAQHRSELNNSPAMQAGKQNVEEQKAKDQITGNVAKRDTEATRRDISLLLLLAFLCFAGCTTTVAPPKAKPATVSFDHGQQNAGLIRFDEQGNGILTLDARNRYNALILTYAGRFVPALEKDAGIKSGLFVEPYGPTYVIDPEHLVKFGQMANWRRNEGTSVLTVPK